MEGRRLHAVGGALGTVGGAWDTVGGALYTVGGELCTLGAVKGRLWAVAIIEWKLSESSYFLLLVLSFYLIDCNSNIAIQISALLSHITVFPSQANSLKLTTAYDSYETLRDITDDFTRAIPHCRKIRGEFSLWLPGWLISQKLNG